MAAGFVGIQIFKIQILIGLGLATFNGVPFGNGGPSGLRLGCRMLVVLGHQVLAHLLFSANFVK
jgi:hypothetical protein